MNYNKRTWLNKEESYSTSNIVTFDGRVTFNNKTIRSTFLHISDCKEIIKLYKTDNDTMQDFIDKLTIISKTINEFKNHLNPTNHDKHYIEIKVKDDLPTKLQSYFCKRKTGGLTILPFTKSKNNIAYWKTIIKSWLKEVEVNQVSNE